MHIEMRMLGENRAEIELYGVISKSNFFGEEDVTTPKQFRDDLKALGRVDEIVLRVNSDGGDVFSGKAIANALKQHPATIVAEIESLAASMAGVIVVEAADKITIAENAFFMVHEARGMFAGTAREMRKRADLIESLTVQSIDSYHKRSQASGKDVSRDTIKQMFVEETFIDAQQAVELGFADEITASVDVDAYLGAGWEQTLPLALQHLVGADAPDQNQQPKEDLMDLTQLKAEHGDLVQALRDEILAEAPKPDQIDVEEHVNIAVQAERERIAEIQEVAPNATLAQEAIERGIAVEQFALEVLKANKETASQVADQMVDDLEPIPGAKPAEESVEQSINTASIYSNINKQFSQE